MSIILHHNCPFCGAQHDRVRETKDGTSPQPSDATLCFSCGEWCVFTNSLSLRKPNDAEYQEIVDEPTFAQVRQAWLIVKGQTK